MGHNHAHHHHHHGTGNKKALFQAFLLIAVFMFVEVAGGILTNSLALLSDAGHMLSDAAALGLSLYAIILGEKKATQRNTYGYRRFEIIAASLNGITLLLIAFYIVYESIQRFLQPPEIQGLGMLTIAILGLLVNIGAAFLLMRGDRENLNVKSAYLHVLGDTLGSIGAIVAALLIYFLGWTYADPIASLIVAVLIAVSGCRVTKEAFHILMEGAPASIDQESLMKRLSQIEGVGNVHDLHIWSLTSEMPMLTCHLLIKHDQHEVILQEAQRITNEEFGIKHCTIQVEREDERCTHSHFQCL